MTPSPSKDGKDDKDEDPPDSPKKEEPVEDRQQVFGNGAIFKQIVKNENATPSLISSSSGYDPRNYADDNVKIKREAVTPKKAPSSKINNLVQKFKPKTFRLFLGP
jgi:hypothetical protein